MPPWTPSRQRLPRRRQPARRPIGVCARAAALALCSSLPAAAADLVLCTGERECTMDGFCAESARSVTVARDRRDIVQVIVGDQLLSGPAYDRSDNFGSIAWRDGQDGESMVINSNGDFVWVSVEDFVNAPSDLMSRTVTIVGHCGARP